MKFLIACCLVLVLNGIAFPCMNLESHESTVTNYDSGVPCGAGACPQSSHKFWTYSCTSEAEHNCYTQSNMIKEYHVDHWCDMGTCTTGYSTIYGDGKVTQLCQ